MEAVQSIFGCFTLNYSFYHKDTKTLRGYEEGDCFAPEPALSRAKGSLAMTLFLFFHSAAKLINRTSCSSNAFRMESAVRISISRSRGLL